MGKPETETGKIFGKANATPWPDGSSRLHLDSTETWFKLLFLRLESGSHLGQNEGKGDD